MLARQNSLQSPLRQNFAARFYLLLRQLGQQQYQQMKNYIEEFQGLKDKIPEFIVKLYHILESGQYSDFICWHGDSEVLIKSGKKLEDKVLPHFFRHKHLSSFIRQLNMYKFSKVNKLTKQKNYMYFRNDHFKRCAIKQMIRIRRNNKKNKKQDGIENADNNDSEGNSDISINNRLEENTALQSYKQFVKNTVREITQSLKKIENNFPESKHEISSALSLCGQLLEVQEQSTNYTQINIEDSLQNKNMLSTMRLIPRIESLIFPSQYSFCQFN